MLFIPPERTPLLSLLPSSLATSLLPERASDRGRRYQAEGLHLFAVRFANSSAEFVVF